MLKTLVRKFRQNPLDALLKKANRNRSKKFLLLWNRGLGDIALGLYAIIHQIKSFVPNAEITFLTRPDLLLGFQLLDGIQAISSPLLVRGKPFSLDQVLKSASLKADDFDVIIEKPDPTYWVKWQLGSLQPKLNWNPAWDLPVENLDAQKKYIGIHIHSETSYGYEKNWPEEKFLLLFEALEKKGKTCLLFGSKASSVFSHKNIIDLRGKTNLIQTMNILKNYCSHFVGPDSGLLSLLYYLDDSFPLKAISLWADPHQGILKQKVISPNPLLEHIPLIAPDQDLRLLPLEKVLECL